VYAEWLRRAASFAGELGTTGPFRAGPDEPSRPVGGCPFCLCLWWSSVLAVLPWSSERKPRRDARNGTGRKMARKGRPVLVAQHGLARPGRRRGRGQPADAVSGQRPLLDCTIFPVFSVGVRKSSV